MEQIGQTNNNYNVYPAQRAVPVQHSERAVVIPDYYVEKVPRKERIEEALESNVLTNAVYGVGKAFFGEFCAQPIASIITWLGLGFLLDKYTNGIGGKYEQSILGKAARFGDNLEQSKFIKSKPMQKVLGGLGFVKKKTGKMVNNSSVLKAMKETPSKPEWGMVKGEMYSQEKRVAEDFMQIMKALHMTDNEQVALKDLALSKQEKEMLKKVFNVKNISRISDEAASNYILLSRVNVPKETIARILAADKEVSCALTKQVLLQEMGLSAEKLKLITQDEFGKYTNDILQATKKVGNKVRICDGNIRILGPLTKPFERTISCDQIYNRLHSIGNGAKTNTGRFMSKLIQGFYRGITFGGGKMGVLIFIAPAAVVAAKNVRKAEPNQKVGTGVNSLVNSISWVLTFPLALKIMHTLGGAQYAGMGKDKVAKYRKIVTDFNDKNAKGLFKTHDAYKAAKKKAQQQLDNLYKVKGQNIFTRGIRKLARGMTIDLERLDTFNTGKIVSSTALKFKHLPRNVFGVPLRFLIWAGISMGVLDTIINKSVKLIFGDSYDSMKEEEIKESKKKERKVLRQDLEKRLYETQKQKVKGQQQQKQQVSNPQQNMLTHKGAGNSQSVQQNVYEQSNRVYIPSQQNVIPQSKQEEKIDNYTYIPSQANVIPQPQHKSKADTYSYIPSQQSTIQSDKNENSSTVRSYIPSQAAANIKKTWDNSGLEAALRKAEKAEKNAMKILAGDFEGM